MKWPLSNLYHAFTLATIFQYNEEPVTLILVLFEQGNAERTIETIGTSLRWVLEDRDIQSRTVTCIMKIILLERYIYCF